MPDEVFTMTHHRVVAFTTSFCRYFIRHLLCQVQGTALHPALIPGRCIPTWGVYINNLTKYAPFSEFDCQNPAHNPPSNDHNATRFLVQSSHLRSRRVSTGCSISTKYVPSFHAYTLISMTIPVEHGSAISRGCYCNRYLRKKEAASLEQGSKRAGKQPFLMRFYFKTRCLYFRCFNNGIFILRQTGC